jgi:glutamyl-Q tRNA(Asp) synthetase
MFSNSVNKTANIPYIGRFAPSPTGPLHFGSLLAAVASYLDAKSNQGQWLVRIEDIDPPREISGSKDEILKALSVYGLFSDQKIVFQSQRSDFYQQALEQLIAQKSVFPCTCSRKQLSNRGGIHFGDCLSNTGPSIQLNAQTNIQNPPTEQDHIQFAWRFDSQFTAPSYSQGNASFHDHLQGLFSQSIEETIGDFVVKRKDQLWAYQLAMVVDDYEQGITHVVRGIDLIDSTLRQNMLQRALGYPIPAYAHIPVACGENGQKLSKQNLAPALDLSHPEETLWRALSWLGQEPPKNLRLASVKEILLWGIQHWQPLKLQTVKSQPAI